MIVADEWHSNGFQDLITASVCHLCGSVETRIHPRRAHFSSVPAAIEGEHLPPEVGYGAKLQAGQDPGEDNEHIDELP